MPEFYSRRGSLRYRLRCWWEDLKIAVSEFYWRYHPHRNRWCKSCGEFIGTSEEEASKHECSYKCW